MPSGMHSSWLRAARKCCSSTSLPMPAGMPSNVRRLSEKRRGGGGGEELCSGVEKKLIKLQRKEEKGINLPLKKSLFSFTHLQMFGCVS